MIEIGDGKAIDESELEFTTSRSSGPGGQNVNKVETRVTLSWDLEATEALDPLEKARVRERLATRITKDGRLKVSSQKHRTQAANREEAVERFAELVAAAIRPRTPRKPTKVSKTAKRKRLEGKRRRSEIKDGRKSPGRWE